MLIRINSLKIRNWFAGNSCSSFVLTTTNSGLVERMDKAAKHGVFHGSQDVEGCWRLMTAKCAERGDAGQPTFDLRRQQRVLRSGEAFGVRWRRLQAERRSTVRDLAERRSTVVACAFRLRVQYHPLIFFSSSKFIHPNDFFIISCISVIDGTYIYCCVVTST